MSSPIVLTLAILFVTAVFFVWGKIRSDIVALCSLLSLVLLGILKPGEALAGFSNSVVIMMVGLFIVGGAIFQTGLAKSISLRLLKFAGKSEIKLFLLVVLVTVFFGSFVSNTGTVALLLPIVVSMATEADTNSRSIGIEIVNAGNRLTPDGIEWADYPRPQVDAVIGLVKEIARRHAIRPDHILGHSDIAPQRKVDPGPRFPWKRLADEGLIAWPDERRVAEVILRPRADVCQVAAAVAGREQLSPHSPLRLDKRDARLGRALDMVMRLYDDGRVIAIADEEVHAILDEAFAGVGVG